MTRGSYHETCAFFYLKTRLFQEFEKHYNRLQYFYRDLSEVIRQPSREQDHIQAIYILYLLTFNRYTPLTENQRIPPEPPSDSD
jgi:hypothetical protein